MKLKDDFSLSKADAIKNALLLGEEVSESPIIDILDYDEVSVIKYWNWIQAGIFSARDLSSTANAEFQQRLLKKLNGNGALSVRTEEDEINAYLEEVIDKSIQEIRPEHTDSIRQYSTKEVAANGLIIDRDIRDIKHIQIAQLVQITPSYISVIKSRIQDDGSVDDFRNEALIAILDQFFDRTRQLDESDLSDTPLSEVDLPDKITTREDILADLYTAFPTTAAADAADLVQTSEAYAQKVKDRLQDSKSNYVLSEDFQRELSRQLDLTSDGATDTDTNQEEPTAVGATLREETQHGSPKDAEPQSGDLDFDQLLTKIRNYREMAAEEEEIYEEEERAKAEARGKRLAAQLIEQWILETEEMQNKSK